jgi:carbamoyl-phosphate synthase large subunit
MGFSDARLAQLALRSAHVDREASESAAYGSGSSTMPLKALTGGVTEAEVSRARLKLGVRPVFKRIDSCAAEFDAATPYLYSTYEAPLFGEAEDEAEISDRRKIVILGGGPNRIGQGIEFDYCCCHAAFALKEAGYETIMVNCNPETVSTDPDTSDRLYFEPLTAEDVLEILRRESEKGELLGVIVQLGGQTPLKLAAEIQAAGYAILGTSPTASTLPRTASGFAKLIDKLKLRQARERPCAQPRRGDRGRPADRLSGAAAAKLCAWRAGDGSGRRARAARSLYATAVQVSGTSPGMIDRYLRDAIEVDVDAICDGKQVAVAGILQHIEEAGVHSGDSACSIPPYSLSPRSSPRSSARRRRLRWRSRSRG